MIIIGLSDIHGDISLIKKIKDPLAAADLVLLAGDLTHFGRRTDAQEVIDAIRQHTNRIIAVPGNCDYPEVDEYLNEQSINLHRRFTRVNGLAFIGIGGSLPCPGVTPNEATEEDFARFLDQAVSGIPDDLPLVMVSHQPPFDTTCDMLATGSHVGSHSVRQFIENYHPQICFTGHIHESAGIDTIGRTRIINPGPLWHGRYAYAELNDHDGQIQELDIRKI